MASHQLTELRSSSWLSPAYILAAKPNCRRLFTQVIAVALFLALARAGSRSAAKTGSIKRKKPETIVPARATPHPFNAPPLRLILVNETIPKIKPTRAVSPRVQNPRMPSTSDAMARPLVLAGVGGAVAGSGGTG